MEQIRQAIESWSLTAGISSHMAVFVADGLLVVVALLLSWLAYGICHHFVIPITVHLTGKTKVEWDDVLLNEQTLRKACLIVPAIVIWMLIPHIFYRYAMVEMILERLTAIYLTIASTKLGLTIVESIKLLDSDQRTARHQYLHTFCGVLKIIVFFIAVIAIVSIVINRSPLTLLAGLGATSAVLMLVFKDAISGLVAGVRLTSNNMLHKGDWITVDKAGINGVVEEITLTTVKVRNYDNTTLTITPQTLVEESFQNWNTMKEGDGRRVTRRIYFDFRFIHPIDDEMRRRLTNSGYVAEGLLTTSDLLKGAVNLTLFRTYADRYLARHADVNGSMLHMVRQHEATPTGLPVEFYFFLRDKEWKGYENKMAAILEHFYAAIPDFGLSIYQRDVAEPIQNFLH
ncbi:MAG: mechanosensitive ion channel family protein [Prevotella sp.]